MRVINTSRIRQTLTLTHRESKVQTQVIVAAGVSELPDEYTIDAEHISYYEPFLSLVGSDGQVVPLSRLGVDTVVQTESESPSQDLVSEDPVDEEEEDA